VLKLTPISATDAQVKRIAWWWIEIDQFCTKAENALVTNHK